MSVRWDLAGSWLGVDKQREQCLSCPGCAGSASGEKGTAGSWWAGVKMWGPFPRKVIQGSWTSGLGSSGRCLCPWWNWTSPSSPNPSGMLWWPCYIYPFSLGGFNHVSKSRRLPSRLALSCCLWAQLLLGVPSVRILADHPHPWGVKGIPFLKILSKNSHARHFCWVTSSW